MTETHGESTSSGRSWLKPLGPCAAWNVILAILIFPVTVTYYLMAPGVVLARKAFGPQPPAVRSARVVQRLQNVRTVAGLAAITILYVLYTVDGVDAMLDDLLIKTLWAMAIGVVALIAGIALVHSLADAGGRRQVRSRLRHPVGAVVMAVGTGGAITATTWLTTLAPQSFWYYLLLVLGVFLAGFTLGLMFMATRHVFKAADVHALLPSLLTPVIAWALAAVELLNSASLPGEVHLVVTLAGAVTVTLLAVAEWIVLRRLNPGLSLRDGLWSHPHSERSGATRP